MSETWVALGLACNSALWICAWHHSHERRPTPAEGPNRGRWVALVGLGAQLATAGALLGATAGAAIVLGAWMFLGGAFALCVSSRPALVSRAARWLGLAGALLVIVPLLLRARG